MGTFRDFFKIFIYHKIIFNILYIVELKIQQQLKYEEINITILQPAIHLVGTNSLLIFTHDNTNVHIWPTFHQHCPKLLPVWSKLKEVCC